MKTKLKDDLLDKTLDELFKRHQKDSLKKQELSVKEKEDKPLLKKEDSDVDFNIKSSKKAKEELFKGLANISNEAKEKATSYNIDTSKIDAKFFDDSNYQSTSNGNIEPVDNITENLPSVITKELLAADNIDIEWTSIKDLPGFVVKDIRALGRSVFSNFTDTNPDDIVTMACTQQGHSLTGHEMRELNAVAGWAKKNAIEKPEYASVINMDFKEYIKSNPRGPVQGNYEPQAMFYETDKISFLLVNDFMGKYIYAWKTKSKEELSQDIQYKLENVNSNKSKRPKLR